MLCVRGGALQHRLAIVHYNSNCSAARAPAPRVRLAIPIALFEGLAASRRRARGEL